MTPKVSCSVFKFTRLYTSCALRVTRVLLHPGLLGCHVTPRVIMAYFRVKFYVSLSSIKVRNHGVQYSVLFSNSDYRVHEYRLHLTQHLDDDDV